jgi:DNA-directed RNA polymerase beta' subunit
VRLRVQRLSLRVASKRLRSRVHRARRAGYIRLELPVFHVGYFKNIIAILQCVCKTCAHVMVPEDERRQFLRRFRSPHTEACRIAGRQRSWATRTCTRRLTAWQPTGERATCPLQKAHGALQTLQDVPLLRRCARCVRRTPWVASLLQP